MDNNGKEFHILLKLLDNQIKTLEKMTEVLEIMQSNESKIANLVDSLSKIKDQLYYIKYVWVPVIISIITTLVALLNK